MLISLYMLEQLRVERDHVPGHVDARDTSRDVHVTSARLADPANSDKIELLLSLTETRRSIICFDAFVCSSVLCCVAGAFFSSCDESAKKESLA